MRSMKYLLAAIVIAMIAAACQAGGLQPPGPFPPATLPSEASTTTTLPTAQTTPPVTAPPATVPQVLVSYLSDMAPAVYQIFGVSTEHVTVTEIPGDSSSRQTLLDSESRNIETTGRRASVKGKIYFEIELVGGAEAWIDAQVLVHQITTLDSAKPANFVVSGGSLNVRSHAGVDHAVISTLTNGATVRSTGHRAEVQGAVWVEIQLTADSTGWVNGSYLTPEVVYLSDDTPATYQVTGLSSGSVNVRKGPGIHTDVIATLAFDATDLVTTGKRAEVSGGVWRQVELIGGTLGWVSAAYLELQPAPVATACRPDSATYCPGLGVSRGAVAAFISRAAGLKDTGGKDWFTDDDGSVFEEDLNRLAAAGIIVGCNPPDNTLACPDQLASRAMAAAWFSRALALTGDGGKDWFSDDAGSIFEADINRLATAGIAGACDGGTKFCPTGILTRGQLAAWTVRAFDLPATSTDYFSDDNGSIFEADINAVAAAGVTRP